MHVKECGNFFINHSSNDHCRDFTAAQSPQQEAWLSKK